MLFSRSFFLALCSAPLLAFAQSANPFNIPNGGLKPTAGMTTVLTWKPTTSGTVSLFLRQGASSHLDEGTAIAMNITNNGSFKWDVPAQTPFGRDYAVEIVDDSDPSQFNFTPPLTIDSTVTVAPMTSTTSVQTTTKASTSMTETPSAFPLGSGVTINTLPPSPRCSDPARSPLERRETDIPIPGSNSDSTTTSTDSSSGMTTMTANTASSSDSPTQTDDTVISGTPSPTTGGAAARATAMLGMLGAVALGALAL